MSMRHGYSRALIGWVAAHDMAWARHGISTGHSCSLVRFVFWPLNTLVPRGDRHRTFCRSHLHPHIHLDRTHPGTDFTVPPTLAPTQRRSIRYLPCCSCHTPRRDVSFSRNTTLPVLYDWPLRLAIAFPTPLRPLDDCALWYCIGAAHCARLWV